MLTLPESESSAPSFLPFPAGDGDPTARHVLSPPAITVPSPSVPCVPAGLCDSWHR